ncbi:Zinc finger, RING-type [Cordyceps fumosorosea ARSEF 2679]|uniref:Zinc finger, RING-type n=1 Tax=Cordyceps fumosorosea (strain ARSEF 2679) TaxID=1081104 RepID=A0A167P8S9_CORFA|nr:Zinc finger, RING-type [Cordyceps fumosorosea ARSEF 2679]OAA56403.1 Zinc finger, RING-type [Cordyceps fumosorosea ARSEF 2679]
MSQQQQQQLPFGYLAQMESYFSTVNAFTAAPATKAAIIPARQQPPPAPLPPTNTTTSNLPDCFRTLRCDGCEMLFTEAGTDEARWTFPCGHVYCAECMRRARSAAERTNVHALCRRCSNIVVRKRDNAPCAHPIPIVSFNAASRATGEGFAGLPDRYRLALGQRTGPKCQLCWLAARLQSLTFRAAVRWPAVAESGFPGELFACVQVDRRRIVHGMRRELPEAEVDPEDDVELGRGVRSVREELARLASDICGGLGQVPMEPNFDPRGDIVVQYRLRGFGRWVRENGMDEGALPVGLRAAVYGEWA